MFGCAYVYDDHLLQKFGGLAVDTHQGQAYVPD
jgi:hypothetical protein